MENIFIEIGLIITLATLLGYILKKLRQPMIPAYVLAGLLIGPAFGLIGSNQAILTMSDIGIAFLLFIVGLEINLKKLKDIGLVAILGGTINSTILFVLGFVIATLLTFNTTESLYLGLIVSFSSTMVVIKLISDKRELDTLHGRILVGILLMEDLLAIILLSLLSNSGPIMSIAKISTILITALLLARFVLPYIFRDAAEHQELLFLLSLSVCFVFSALALSMGLSIVIGAFVAGITIANLPYRVEIISRIRPLRDFFATIFFVSLGMQLKLSNIANLILPLILLFILISIIKPFLLMNIVSLFGYRKKTSFLTGISLAQISEFALVITALGKSLGQISDIVFTLAILLAISTIVLSSYILKYDSVLFHYFSNYLGFLDRNGKYDELTATINEKNKDTILCGYNRIGYNIANSLQKINKPFLVVDYNPEVIKQLMIKGVPCIYGDIGDVDILERLDISNASMVISTIPDITDTHLLIQKVREKNKSAALIVTASHLEEALNFYNAGADYVVLPHFLGGEHVSKLIELFQEDPVHIITTRMKHIEELQIREDLGHEHPTHD